MHNGRRLLYRADRVRQMLDCAHNTLAAEYRDEIAALRREVDELREVALLLTSLTRERYEGDLVGLRAQLEGVLVRLTQRPAATALH
jgi:hypothetical protein